MKLAQLVERAGAELQAAGLAYGQGTTNARDEAAWLVLWRLGLPLDSLDEPGEGRDVDRAAEARVMALVHERIATRQPAAYLTGEAWLQGVPFYVDERVIVPRSLLAEPLADGAIDAWLGDEPDRVLDLCTGCGALAVLAALAWPEARVLATDISAAALAMAERNRQRHALQRRIELRQGDGLAALRPDEAFDLVLCNPPYVNAASMAALPAEFRAEPALALAGGGDGMDFIRALLPAAARHLSARGVLVLEIGHEKAHFDAAFPTLEPLWLPTSEGDEQALLLTREMLAALPAPAGGAGGAR